MSQTSAYHRITPLQYAARLEATRRWRQRNPAKVREAKRAYLAEHAGFNAKQCRQWRRNNPGKARAAVRRWHAAHPDRVLQLHREWNARNPSKTLAAARKRQAAVRRALCRCCGPVAFARVYERARRLRLEVDHKKPLSKGGKHCCKNLQLLTSHANRVKAARWAAR